MDTEFNGMVLAFVMVGWIFSVCVHEFSHAIVAYHGGDRSVKEKGYLSFNPFLYAHPITSVVLPLLFVMIGGIALPGGAVYIDNDRLRSRHWDCAVSLAGPLSNVLLLALLLIPFWLGLAPQAAIEPAGIHLFWPAYACLCLLQVMAILLNILPVPPLDGFQALAAYLHPRHRRWFNRNGDLFLLGLIVVLWRVPAANMLFFSTVDSVATAIGVPLPLAFAGYDMMRLRL